LPDDDPNDQRAPGDQPVPPSAAGAGVTPGGYAYSVVNDDEPATAPHVREPKPKSPPRKIGIRPVALAAAIIIPALIVGIGMYLFASSSGGGNDDRVERNVTNVINAFTQSDEGGGAIRYEGELPPSFPEDVPRYPGSEVISGIVQLRGDDATYIAVFDSDDSRDDVAAYFADAFDEDPWQVEIEQAGRESTVLQFSNIEDADVAGVVLAAESDGGDVTTIFMSINVVGGADDIDTDAFDPGAGRALPDGYPESDVPRYDQSTVIETGYQQTPQGRDFLVTLVTQDGIAEVLDFYRDHFGGNGWTVEDAAPGSSELEDGEAITFSSDDGETVGSVQAGVFGEDDDYNQISIQVSR
jgi:hypothetical protein